MSIDVTVRCALDPACLGEEPYRSCPIAYIGVRGREVELNFKSAAYEVAMRYVELVAAVFDGTIWIDGETVDRELAPDPVPRAALERRWRELDAETVAVIAEAEAAAARRQAAWEALDRAGPGVLDRHNDWSDVMPADPAAAQPPAVETAGSVWTPAARVRHPRFGDGVVESVTGTGESAKVRVRFGSEARLVLARFLSPASD